jgi:peptidoglycan/xylan/chitin deacetylase (PgdA/CDA1 family)
MTVPVTPSRRRILRAALEEQFWSAVRTARRSRWRPPPADDDQRDLSGPAYDIWDVTASAGPNAVALTIDDGPDPRWTPQVLDLLAQDRVTATFFLVGAQARRFPGIARRIARQGHAIGNHSARHFQPYAAQPARCIHEDIQLAQLWIRDAAGVTPGSSARPAAAGQEPCSRVPE